MLCCFFLLPAKSKDAKAQATKAAKELKKNNRKKVLKVRTNVTFHRPKTLEKPRDPKYPRISAPPTQKLDQFQVGCYEGISQPVSFLGAS